MSNLAGTINTLAEAVGVSGPDVPPCLAEYWSDAMGGPADEGEARKLIIVFAMYHRDHLVGKEATKKILKGWSIGFVCQLSEHLIDSEVERAYGSEQRLSCDLIKESVLAKYCEPQMCDYPRTGPGPRAWHDSGSFRIEDICELSTRRDGSKSVKFSPDKAAAALIKEYPMVSTPDERIWVYRDGIYSPDGEVFVDQILDRMIGDLYNSRAASETHRKIVLRTMRDYKVFDADPYLFCVENGVVNMLSGKFLEHDPAHYLTSKSPVKFDSSATCPEIERFMGSALGSIDNVLSFLDIMTAKCTDLLFEYFVALIGGGSNGKTIAEELIRAFFGDETISEVDLVNLTQNRFDRRELFKKKFLINSEVSGDVKESRWIKYISGGGRIDADQKGKDHIQFRPKCLIIFDTNNPPKFADSSYAFQRRLVKIDFTRRFVDDPKEENERERDPFIIQKITSHGELSGLLNLLLLRARDVLPEKKIHRRADGKTMAAEYKMQSNPIEEFFEIFAEFDPGSFAGKSMLYEKYLEFCKEINTVPQSSIMFNRYAIKGLKLEEKRKEEFGVGFIRVLWGIEFNEDAFTEFMNLGSSGDLPEKSIPIPGLPTLPTLKRVVERVISVYGGNKDGSKSLVSPVEPGAGSDKVGKNPVDELGKTTKEEIEAIQRQDATKEQKFITPVVGHHFTPDGRNLDEDGDWEDCELCGLPLPPSWQRVHNDSIFCQNCLDIIVKRRT
jgi:P4 family phage/plasmid primase-like protien